MKLLGRLGLGLGLLIVLLGGLFFLFRNQIELKIGERVFAEGVKARIGRDMRESLPDGLHVFVCGAGSPMPDPYRAGPCIGVLAGQQAFVFDAGSGGVRNLQRMGFPVGSVGHVFLTHVHSDHIDGLGELMLQVWIGGTRSAPVPISGPMGVADVVAGFNAAYRVDSAYRIAHHGTGIANPAGFGGQAQEIDLVKEQGGSAVVYDQNGVRITAFLVNHAPVEPAFGYRVDYEGRSVVLSGDTVYDLRLVRAAKGTDVMLHEALEPKMVQAIGAELKTKGQNNLAQIMTDIQNYHASPEDAARAAKETGAKALFLYHIVPPLPSRFLEAVFLEGTGAIYKGPIQVARDGMIISLPSADRSMQVAKGF